MNGLIDLRYNLWGRKYEVYFNEVYLKSVSHHKIWFLTNFSSNAAHFLSIQAIFTDLTFNLSFKLYLLTSDLNFSVENTKSVCMKFTHWVYFTLKIYFLIKCSLFQVQTRHITDFEPDLDIWPWKKLSKKLEEKSSFKIGLGTSRLQQLTWTSHGNYISCQTIWSTFKSCDVSKWTLNRA